MAALVSVAFLALLDLYIPQPNIVTNSGAASPPSPATMYARVEVCVVSDGFQVAAAWTMTINNTASPLKESISLKRMLLAILIIELIEYILLRF
jgi:hypothetical protein